MTLVYLGGMLFGWWGFNWLILIIILAADGSTVTSINE